MGVGRPIQGGGVSAGQGGQRLSGHRGRLGCDMVAHMITHAARGKQHDQTLLARFAEGWPDGRRVLDDSREATIRDHLEESRRREAS